MTAADSDSDLMLPVEPSGTDIQFSGQNIGRQIRLDQHGQFAGRTCPSDRLLFYKQGDLFRERIRRFLPQFRFFSGQLPDAAFQVEGQIQPLILLITADHIQGCMVVGPLFFLQQQSAICTSEEPIGSGDRIKPVFRS